MKRQLSTRTIAILGVVLAAGAVVFCWRWAVKYSSGVDWTRGRILSVEHKQDELRHQILNLAALVLKASEEPPRSYRIAPTDSKYVTEYDYGSTRTRKTMEAARGDLFLRWYYAQIERDYEKRPSLRDLHN